MGSVASIQFGSGKCLNLGPDHRFRSSLGLNRFEPVKFPTQFSARSRQKDVWVMFENINSLVILFIFKAFPDGLG